MRKNCSPDKILKLVRQISGLRIDDPEADLLACGLESIVLLEIIAIIENEYDLELNLDKLESKSFIINATNLFTCMEFKFD